MTGSTRYILSLWHWGPFLSVLQASIQGCLPHRQLIKADTVRWEERGRRYLLVSPKVGRMPTRLQCEAGPLTEFPVSVPKPTKARLAATAACSTPSQIITRRHA